MGDSTSRLKNSVGINIGRIDLTRSHDRMMTIARVLTNLIAIPSFYRRTKKGQLEVAVIDTDRWLIVMFGAATLYLLYRITFLPVAQLTFFGDDFAFLNWASALDPATWLKGLFESGGFASVTYRPIAAIIYLIYLNGSAPFGYFLLSLLFAINIFILFWLYRVLSNLPIAALSLIIFAGAFIYFDATHKIYNLITQVSAAFFLTAVYCFVSADSRVRGTRFRHMAHILYALSLLTYEITLFGFTVFFALALRKEWPTDVTFQTAKSAILRSLKSSWVFGIIAAAYLTMNLFSPIKTAHLQDHAVPLSLATVPVIFGRGSEVLKNTCAWLYESLRFNWAHEVMSLEYFLVSAVLIVLVSLLFLRSPLLKNSEMSNLTTAPLWWLALFGLFWFVVLLLPGAVSNYFDYRMTFLAYAGLSLALAACLSLVYRVAGARFTGSRFGRWLIALSLGAVVTSWVIGNISLANTMNRSLIRASIQQTEIVASLRRYSLALSESSVIVIRYTHNPTQMVPYPYLASPFAEDYALKEAVKYYFGLPIDGASVFFRPNTNNFEIGRFSFAREEYPYNRLVLFDFADKRLVRR